MSNRMSSAVSKVTKLPAPLRTRALSTALGTVVPLVGTAGIVVEELTESRAVVFLDNRRRVQNHIGSIHAAAITLLAETATGFVIGMNVPDDRTPVVKTIAIEFKKRAKGAMRAVATLTDEQRALIRDTPKGETTVAVVVTDEEGKEPVVATMVWAWTPARREGA